MGLSQWFPSNTGWLCCCQPSCMLSVFFRDCPHPLCRHNSRIWVITHLSWIHSAPDAAFNATPYLLSWNGTLPAHVKFSTASLPSFLLRLLPVTAVQCCKKPVGDHPDWILMGTSNSQKAWQSPVLLSPHGGLGKKLVKLISRMKLFLLLTYSISVSPLH